jgi:hypothetical protein
MSWQVQVTDRNFVPQGQVLNLQEIKVGITLNKTRTASFKVRLDNTMAPFLANRVSSEPIYAKIYRHGSLLANSPVMTVQEAGDEAIDAALTVNAVGPEFIWAFRFYNGKAVPLKLASGTSRGAKFKTILDAYVESVTPSNKTFIDHTTGPIIGGGTGEVEIQSYKTVAEILTELTNTIEGFDWTVWPTEPVTVSGVPTIGRLEAQEKIGSTKPNAVFEWGGNRNNIATFSRTVDVTSVANSIYSVPPSGPESPGAPVQNAIDTAKAEEWQLRQALAPLSAQSIPLRKLLAEEALAVRKLPRQTFTFTPIVDNSDGTVPQFGIDYNIGDIVRARVIYNQAVNLDVFARVWGVSFAVDQDGKETQTLTLSEE